MSMNHERANLRSRIYEDDRNEHTKTAYARECERPVRRRSRPRPKKETVAEFIARGGTIRSGSWIPRRYPH